MRNLALLVVCASSLSLAGCVEDAGDGPGREPTTLVGSWQRAPHAFAAGAPVEDLDFLDDGVMVRTIGDDTRVYDYTDNGASITLVDRGPGAPHEATYPFRLVRDGYLANALEATGEVDGAVGTWCGTAWLELDQLDQCWTLRPGGAAEVSYVLASTGRRIYAASWRAEGDDVELTVQADEGAVVLYPTVNGRFLGVPAYLPRE